MTRTEKLADFVCGLTYDQLPPEVVQAGKNIIMDTLGCAVGTTKEDPWKAETAWKIARFSGGKEECTALVSGYRLPVMWAGFANAILCHGIDFDDTHKQAVTHTSAPIVPAAVAVSEALGVSGKDLILAAVIGFEVTTRVGMCVCPSHYNYWHSTATNGTFGAAALTARLYGGGKDTVINALGLAGAQAAGLLTYTEFGDFSKSFNPGKSSFNGILAGVAATMGATAPPVMLEHKRGYSYAYSPAGPKLEMLDKDLGKTWEILNNVPKPWPCILAAHPPIEAIQKIYKKHHINPKDIVRVTDRTYHAVIEKFACYTPPTTMAARLSVPYCVAVAALTGDNKLCDFTPEAIKAPDVQEMLKKVVIESDPELTAAFPDKIAAIVTIETADGAVYTETVNYPKGDRMNPFTQEEMESKFRMLTSPVFGKERTEEILNTCRYLEEVKDVREFVKMFVK